MIGNSKMEQFVDDDIVLQFGIEGQNIRRQRHPSRCRTRCPFVRHRADMDLLHVHADAGCPIDDPLFQQNDGSSVVSVIFQHAS